MLKKTIGIIIFLMAVFFQIGQDNFINFFDKQMLAFIAASSLGLIIATYKKEMTFMFCLKKFKKYVVYAGWAGALIAILNITHNANVSNINIAEVKHYSNSISAVFLPIFWGYLIAIFVDIFIREE